MGRVTAAARQQQRQRRRRQQRSRAGRPSVHLHTAASARKSVTVTPNRADRSLRSSTRITKDSQPSSATGRMVLQGGRGPNGARGTAPDTDGEGPGAARTTTCHGGGHTRLATVRGCCPPSRSRPAEATHQKPCQSLEQVVFPVPRHGYLDEHHADGLAQRAQRTARQQGGEGAGGGGIRQRQRVGGVAGVGRGQLRAEDGAPGWEGRTASGGE